MFGENKPASNSIVAGAVIQVWGVIGNLARVAFIYARLTPVNIGFVAYALRRDAGGSFGATAFKRPLRVFALGCGLERLTPKELRDRYAEVYGEATRSGKRTWLVRRIAWRLQAQAEGDLSTRARARGRVGSRCRQARSDNGACRTADPDALLAWRLLAKSRSQDTAPTFLAARMPPGRSDAGAMPAELTGQSECRVEQSLQQRSHTSPLHTPHATRLALDPVPPQSAHFLQPLRFALAFATQSRAGSNSVARPDDSLTVDEANMFPSHRPEVRARLCLEQLEERETPSAGIGVFNPDTATWSLRSTASPGASDVAVIQFGIAIPVVGDWNGDGRDDIGSFNRDTAVWSLRYGTTEGPPDAGVFQFGAPGSLPVVGDWNGDGRDDIGVFAMGTGTWSLRLGASGGPANAGVFQFGTKYAIPVVGDWDGDGKDGIGTFDKNTTIWTLRQTANAGLPDAGTFKFGSKGTLPVVGDWNGDGVDGIGTFDPKTTTWSLRQIASAGVVDMGTFQFGTKNAIPIVGDFTDPAAVENDILTLTLKPLDIDLLGLKVQSSPITVTVSAEAGDGKLLGNLLTTVDQVLNLDQINAAVNSVLGATVDLLNAAALAVSGVGGGVFDTAPTATTQVLELFVDPVRLDVMGAIVTTSPIRLSISATAGPGLILGNVLTALSDLFNNPPEQLDLAFINARLAALLSDLRAQLPNFSSGEVPPPVLEEGDVLALTIPAINLDLLGLMLKTTPITVDVSSREGDGLLLGNVLSSALSTLNATPAELSELSGHLNNVLAYVVGVLNNASLTLAPGAVDTLSDLLQRLTLPDLVTATPGQTTDILDLVIAQPDGSPPVTVDLLGLNVQVGGIDAELSARTGEGLILGNLLYNVANLVNPGGPAALISLLTSLGGGTTSNLGDVTVGLSPTATGVTPVLTLTLAPLDIDLLGVEVKTTEPITITVSAVEGSGNLLGNVLTAVSSLLNTQGIGAALNNVLDSVVGLLNGLDLSVATGSGQFDTASTSVTPIADVFVAPIRLDLLGALVETSPIHLTITAYAGEGLILGNVLTALSDLFNDPPEQLDLAFINSRLDQLLAALNEQITTPSAPTTAPMLGEGDILAVTIPALDLDLLGLVLQTSPITVTASSTEGDGLLLGNVLSSVLSTLNATPEELTQLSTTINAILAKVVGALNNVTALLPPDLLATLTGALGTLAQFDLLAPAPGSTATILDLTLTAPDGTPVQVDLLGLHVTTSNIDATLSAYTGEGLVLGNLLYNVANLLNPGSSLLSLLLLLGR